MFVCDMIQKDTKKPFRQPRKSMEQNESRLDYIDILKGCGILLMVLGHMWFEQFDYETYIYAFHMPLFVLLSGYLYKTPGNLAAGLKRKMKSLLFPYFVFGMIYFCAYMIFAYQPGADWAPYLKSIFLISVDGLPYESALWFLMALFWTWLIYVLLERVCKDPWVLGILLILLGAVGSLWGSYVPFLLPWGIQNALAMLPFFGLGHLFRSLQGKSPVLGAWERLSVAKRVFVLIIGLVVNGIFIYKNGKVDLRSQTWQMIPATYFNAVCAVWLWSEMVMCVLQKTKSDALPWRFLKQIGRYSIVWLCINHRVIWLAKRIVYRLPFQLPGNFLTDALIVVLSIVILYLLMELFMRTPLRVLFGKWKDRPAKDVSPGEAA